MDPGDAAMTLLNRIWVKLQGLPTANEMEVAGFFILLIFISLVLIMTLVTCLTFCCTCCQGKRGSIN